jgi:hypothetical protein
MVLDLLWQAGLAARPQDLLEAPWCQSSRPAMNISTAVFPWMFAYVCPLLAAP